MRDEKEEDYQSAIRIVCRIRKMFDNERLDPSRRERGYEIFEAGGKKVIKAGKGERTENFIFPVVMPEDTSQEGAFEWSDMSRRLWLVMEDGKNVSVFAYG